jgi:DNA polymerase III epsilon subunit-like protein
MAIHAMIDLETLDTKPSCTILTLGAVKFDPNSDAEPHSELYFKINIDEQSQLGRTVSDDTIKWWSQQDAKVQEEAFSETGRIDVNTVANELTKWIHNTDVIWGHGYGFDITILEDYFRMLNRPIPWQFWQVRDSRTLFSAMKNGDPRKGMQTDLHNALADAYYQAKSVQMAYKELGITR